MEKSPCLIGGTSSQGSFSIVLLVFESVPPPPKKQNNADFPISEVAMEILHQLRWVKKQHQKSAHQLVFFNHMSISNHKTPQKMSSFSPKRAQNVGCFFWEFFLEGLASLPLPLAQKSAKKKVVGFFRVAVLPRHSESTGTLRQHNSFKLLTEANTLRSLEGI